MAVGYFETYAAVISAIDKSGKERVETEVR